MDLDILSFFNSSAPCQRVTLPSAQVNGVLNSYSNVQENAQYEDEFSSHNTEYVEKYVKEEEELCLKLSTTIVQENNMNRPETPTSLASVLQRDLATFGVLHELYTKERKFKVDLPVFDFQNLVEMSINSNSVVIIQGPTGCGKTTQVPQFIMDSCYSNKKYCKIAVAQPRRLAAISIARRVCEERAWAVGSVVGYQVGLDNKSAEDSVITYMTTGVLLHKLINQKNMNEYTHVILDEIHERNQEMDFLLLLVRKFSRTNSTQTKVVLMSATIDVESFSRYFSIPCGNKFSSAVIVDVTKKQKHDVNIYYLNQFSQLLSEMPDFNRGEPILHECLHRAVLRLLTCFNEMDAHKERNGSVLVFLPGIHEIEELYELLKDNESEGSIKWYIVPLHSSITVEEQRKAFEIPQAGYRKIILSTNIAESSITVPDVVYVIDFCLTKMMVCDTKSNYSSLKLEWASHTNCQQRAGRVGRVSSGKVYRLVPEEFYNRDMDIRQIPEMLRCPLHRLVLYAKILDLDIPPHGVLALAMDPPNLTDIEQTISLLKEVGALLVTSKGIYSRRDGDLTYLGSIIGHIPLDLHAAKLIALGYLFSCAHETTVIASGTSFNIFSSPFKERMKAYMSKLSWADGSCSDLIAYLHVYSVWERNRTGNLFGPGGERAWMKRNFLQPQVMKEWRYLITDIKRRLEGLGLTEPVEGRTSNLSENEKGMMIKVAVCGAYYPNYFVRSSEGGQVDESVAVRTLGGRDPYTTVYFTGKPQDQPGPIYAQTIRKLLKECGQNIQISFDKGSSKVYVQFKRELMREQTRARFSAVIPGKIPLEVYRAVKYRQLKLPTVIPSLNPQEAERCYNQWCSQKKQKTAFEINEVAGMFKSVVPCMETMFIQLQITHVNNPGHFYAHNVSDSNIYHIINDISNKLNDENKLLKGLSDQPSVGMLYAAPFQNLYYRARIVSVVPYKNELLAQVLYVDFGNTDSIPIKHLKIIPTSLPTFPPLAIECVLTGVQPSLALNSHALWINQAKDFLCHIIGDRKLFGKIYSVVDDVVSLELFVEKYSNKSINQQLIDAKFAEPAEESYLSKDNHKKREDIQASLDTMDNRNSYEIEWFDEQNEMSSPKAFECRSSFPLKGPTSPLEMQIYSLIECSQNKTVSIEWSSVNSVLLDVDPQNPHDRLLVAATVGQKIDGARLSLRHTTLMPNIHGFTAMMAMLFCTTMELHCDKDGTKITSILCGLGYDKESKRSYYPAHDVIVNLDFELTNQDITFINELRYFLNMGFQAISCYKNATHPKMSVENCQIEIRNRIRMMFGKSRNSLEREILPTARLWGSIPSNVEIIKPEYIDEEHDIWTMHSGLHLNDPVTVQLKAHVKDMYNMANNTLPMTEITCKFCDITLFTIHEMRIHLVSQSHKEKERQNPV